MGIYTQTNVKVKIYFEVVKIELYLFWHYSKAVDTSAR